MQATLKDESIIAVRIQPEAKSDHRLAIREVVIESDPRVTVFKYPVEFFIDVADGPEMKEWAEKVTRICTRAYPMINEELKSDGFKPPSVVTLALKTSLSRRCFCLRRGRITGSVSILKSTRATSVPWFTRRRMSCNITTAAETRDGWWRGSATTSGFSSSSRGKSGESTLAHAHYNGSYRVTAAFLDYVTRKYDKQLVLKLNKAMREGRYKKEIFKEVTGKSLEELDMEWITALRR